MGLHFWHQFPSRTQFLDGAFLDGLAARKFSQGLDSVRSDTLEREACLIVWGVFLGFAVVDVVWNNVTVKLLQSLIQGNIESIQFNC